MQAYHRGVFVFRQLMAHPVWLLIRALSLLLSLLLMSLVPQLPMNLISVGQLIDMNYFVGFDDSSCFVQDCQTRALIGTACCHRGALGLYVLDHPSLHHPLPFLLGRLTDLLLLPPLLPSISGTIVWVIFVVHVYLL